MSVVAGSVPVTLPGASEGESAWAAGLHERRHSMNDDTAEVRGASPVRFSCGHGASGEEALVTLRRECPLCMLLGETKRTRSQLLAKVAPARRSALARETRIGEEYEWICERGHSRYRASVREVLTGPGCQKCLANAQAPGSRFEGGVAFMKPGLKTRTSMTEQRLRVLLAERIRLPHRVNAVKINRTFYGKPEV